jgi:hypothetical protein
VNNSDGAIFLNIRGLCATDVFCILAINPQFKNADAASYTFASKFLLSLNRAKPRQALSGNFNLSRVAAKESSQG